MPDIEVVSSPRPEDGHEPPLPTYHELLNTLCDEFHVPGSPTFSEAVRYIKDHSYPPTIQRLRDWCILEGQGSSDIVLGILETYAVTPEGRQRIAESYINPARQRAQMMIANGATMRDTTRQAALIESLIQCFPEQERFCPPLMYLRQVLLDLYRYMSPNYEPVPYQDPEYEDPTPVDRSLVLSRALRDAGIPVQVMFTSEDGIVIEVPPSFPIILEERGARKSLIFGRSSDLPTPVPTEEPPYEGPRPTLFEHLFREED
jgi:hypothetical protein